MGLFLTKLIKLVNLDFCLSICDLSEQKVQIKKKYQQLELTKNANEVKDLSNLKYVKSEDCNDVSFG